MSRERITPPAKSEWIPNTFVTPNVFVDKLMPLLSAEECVVLVYATRKIFGWHKREDRISISQFCHGSFNEEGQRNDHGTGLSIEAVSAALKELDRFGILIRVDANDPKKNKGALYTLSPDGESVDWIGLIERRDQKEAKNRERTQKMRANRGKKKVDETTEQQPEATAFYATEGVNSAFYATEGERSMPQKGSVLSDRNTKTTLNPTLNPSHPSHPSLSGNQPSQPPLQTRSAKRMGWMEGLSTNELAALEYLRRCGVKAEHHLQQFCKLPLSIIEREWASVHNSRKARDKAACLITQLSALPADPEPPMPVSATPKQPSAPWDLSSWATMSADERSAAQEQYQITFSAWQRKYGA